MEDEPEDEELKPDKSMGAIFEAFGIRAHVSVDEARFDGKLSKIEGGLSRPVQYQWKDFETEQQPASPEDEYYDSDLEITEGELCYRWEGFLYGRRIMKLYRIPYLERQHERVRRRLEAKNILSATDPRYDEYFTNKLALFCDQMTEEQIKRVLSREEITQKRVMTKEGVQFQDCLRPMEVSDEKTRFKNIEILQKISNLAKGKATEILETRQGRRTTADDLRDAVRVVMMEGRAPVVVEPLAIKSGLEEAVV